MVVGERRDLRLVRNAKNLLARGKFLQPSADRLRNAASDADVDLIEYSGPLSLFFAAYRSKHKHQTRNLTARRYLRKRPCRFAEICRKIEFRVFAAFGGKRFTLGQTHLEYGLFQSYEGKFLLNCRFEFCGRSDSFS